MSIQDLASLIKIGHGSFRDDPQSGSILKLLGENGFKEKIISGATRGHTYTIIHNPPSTEFLLVDTWNDGAHPRKAYHAFTIKSALTQKPLDPSTPQDTASTQEHPFITTLKQLHEEADQLLRLVQKYV